MSTRDVITLPSEDPQIVEAVRARLDALAKPPGSLGKLEDLAVAMARASAPRTRAASAPM